MTTDTHPIARIALALQQTHIQVPPIEILDLAMQGRADAESVFASIAPPAAGCTSVECRFGRLLKDAFAPSMQEPREAESSVTSASSAEFLRRWETEVLARFEARYGIQQVDDSWVKLCGGSAF